MNLLASPLYQTALALLARRDHSSKELQQKLQHRYPERTSEIAAVLQHLQAQQYQSDTRFAESYLHARLNKGFGLNRIRLELSTKGVSENDIHSLIQQQAPSSAPQVLYKTWLKKFKTAPRTAAEKYKHIQFLRYRGFTQSQINAFFEDLPKLMAVD